MFIPTQKFSSLLTDNLYLIVDALKEYDYDVRIVGGAVRDLLTGKSPRDVDLATTALPDEIMYLLEKNNLQYTTRGIMHGTVKVVFSPQEEYEITTRDYVIQDRGTGQNLDIEHDPDWIADANRRDFTINSLMLDLSGEIHDYVGGLKDLNDHRIRMVGDPEKRIKNNPNLIVRFFKALGYFPGEAKIDLMLAKTIRSNIGLLSKVDPEWMQKQVNTFRKYPNGERAYRLMQDWKPGLTEKREIIHLEKYRGKEVEILIDPGAQELVGFLKRTKNGEARSLFAKSSGRSGRMESVMIGWDAFEADHQMMGEALRKHGWTVRPKPLLEFSSENRGYGSTDIARSGLIEYGPIWGTNSRLFRQSWLAQSLTRLARKSEPSEVVRGQSPND